MSTGSWGGDVEGRNLDAFLHSECYVLYPAGKQYFSSTPLFLSSIMWPALMVVSEEKDERQKW